jgi:membrane fusion protein (multidrug efflux system)
MNQFEKITTSLGAGPGQSFKIFGRRISVDELRWPLFIAGGVIVVAAVLYFWLFSGRYVSTDDSSVQSERVAVSANVSGKVIAIEVHNNQLVKPGQVLFRIESAPYQATVDEAEAKLATARSLVTNLRASYWQAVAAQRAAKDQLSYATRESGRQRELQKEGISSQAQADQAALAAQNANQQVQSTSQQVIALLSGLGGNPNSPTDLNSKVREAAAVLKRAQLDLGYTTVRAAKAGIVTKVDDLPIGSYVEASKTLFFLMGRRLWVEANFKEDQLEHMRVGQPARVRIDAFPDLDLKAHVSSFSPGTGNTFALLPPENSTGNWVKVVQRLPVEVMLDEVPKDVPLHAGLSATVTVDTRP